MRGGCVKVLIPPSSIDGVCLLGAGINNIISVSGCADNLQTPGLRSARVWCFLVVGCSDWLALDFLA